MGADKALDKRRHKKLALKKRLCFVRALIGFLRIVFRVMELVSPHHKRDRLRRLREKMTAITQIEKQAKAQIRSGSAFEGIECVNSTLMEYATPDDRVGLEETLMHSRTVRQESEALQAIHHQYVGDKAAEVTGYRTYLLQHRESHSAHSYLAGVLNRMGDYDGSLVEYREAIRLAGEDSISGSSTRIMLGEVMLQHGDHASAIREFRLIVDSEAPAAESTTCFAYYELGDALRFSGDEQGALAAWKQAVRWDMTGIIAKKARERMKERQ